MPKDRAKKQNTASSEAQKSFMLRALTLARRGQGLVSPNPAVGAVLVKKGVIIGEGWHRGPGQAHAEVDAIRDAQNKHHSPQGSELFVTLEPCSTFGRTPPCTQAIMEHQIKAVHVATRDPNPLHAGRGFELLRSQGIRVSEGLCSESAAELNAGFNHWIVHRSPLVTVKTAMTLDGKIATADGHSRWITGLRARKEVMKMRLNHDAILVGIETVLHDDPSLTTRIGKDLSREHPKKQLRRIVLDTRARTPLQSKLCSDPYAHLTTIAVGNEAPSKRIKALEKKVSVWVLPTRKGHVSLKSLLNRLGKSNLTSLMVEGGGQVNGAFFDQHLAHRIAFFYGPKILGGKHSRPAVGGHGFDEPTHFPQLTKTRWQRLGPDLLLTAHINHPR